MKGQGNSVISKLDKLPSVSVVIPTRDRIKDLKSLLQSLLKQVSPPSEIIIIDDSVSSDVSEEIIHLNPQFASINCKLQYLKGSNDGLTKARNLGIKASEGDIICFIDDDTELTASVVIEIATFFKDTPMPWESNPELFHQKNFNLRLWKKKLRTVYITHFCRIIVKEILCPFKDLASAYFPMK